MYRKMKKILICMYCLFLTAGLQAQAYKIGFTFKGEKNKQALIAMHYGASKYSVDSAQIDKHGYALFTGAKPLKPGMYLIAVGGGQVLDFLISDTVNQTFNVSLTKGKYLESLKFDGSPENQAFVDYSRFLMKKQSLEDQLKKQTKKPDADEPDAAYAEMDSLTAEASRRVMQLEREFPGSLLALMAKALNPVMPQKDEVPVDEKARARYLYNFMMQHYWDNICLTDTRMQNTPVLIPALDNYFKNLPQTPDSLIKGVDMVVAAAEADTAMYRFVTAHVFNKFVESKIMTSENVLIHIIDHYYLSGKISTDTAFHRSITEYVRKNREGMIGTQAHELKLTTFGGEGESLYDIDSPYTLLIFFEPTCGHCKQEVPKIYKVFQSFKDKGLYGLCVYSQTDFDEWQKFVAKNQLTDWTNAWDPEYRSEFRKYYSVYTVPQVYLLDSDKMIIGRHLDSVSLSQMLHHLLK
jgi:thiol-disulfide isomerase/thioredoxin